MIILDRDLEYLIFNYKSGFFYYDVVEVNKVYGCVFGKYFRFDLILWRKKMVVMYLDRVIFNGFDRFW